MIGEDTKQEECDWCRKTSLLYTEVGHFRDFDSDYSYGIGICPGCGGVGVTYEIEEFKQRVERIRKLRKEYCLPNEGTRSDIRFKKLRVLIREVIELHEKYGEEGTKCFAKDIKEGKLKTLVNRLYEKVQRAAENPN